MAKVMFVCNNCGYESGKWYGKCPECGEWNTFAQISVEDTKAKSRGSRISLEPQKIGEVARVAETRTSTGFAEFDRVLGGRDGNMGIVPGSVLLLSGDPGVGKSTILLQLAIKLADSGKNVMYVTGEESESQVKMRAERIETDRKKLDSLPLFILSTTDIDAGLESAEKSKPDLVIIDSIQTMLSTELTGFAGSIPQIRYATSRLVTFAKGRNIPVFMIGHVTKDGMVAGPMILSHMVDTVLYLEGESITGTRILRTFKNRFGDTSEVGIFIMEEKGLIELADASSFFVDKKDGAVPGSCVAVVMEGSRPILVEVQALVVPTTLSFPRRVANGIAEKRLELLLAVLQKHARIPVERMDVFVNIVGGLKIQEPAADLAVCMAIISSVQNKALASTAAIAEVGLLGELKSVVNLDKRIKEADKLGFHKVVSAKKTKYLHELAKGSAV
jgi:DNA repair protein RadA/Sms